MVWFGLLLIVIGSPKEAKKEISVKVKSERFVARLAPGAPKGLVNFSLRLVIEKDGNEVFRTSDHASGSGSPDKPFKAALYGYEGEPLGLKSSDLTGDGVPEVIAEFRDEEENEQTYLIVVSLVPEPKLIFDSTEIPSPPAPSRQSAWQKGFLIKAKGKSQWIEARFVWYEGSKPPSRQVARYTYSAAAGKFVKASTARAKARALPYRPV